jgi:hypothetical protein
LINVILSLKDGATPRFHKPRPIPFARKPKVEAELDRLEAAGIVKRVTHSEWASPIVTPVKKNGDLRVSSPRISDRAGSHGLMLRLKSQAVRVDYICMN